MPDRALGGGDALGVLAGQRRPGLLLGQQDDLLLVARRLVALGVLAVRRHEDHAALHAVPDRVGVLALEAEADPLGDDEGQDRPEEEHHAEEPGRGEQRHVEPLGDDVVRAAEPQQPVERHGGHARRGADRGVARTVVDVVLALVAGHPRLEERPQGGARHDDPEGEQGGDQHAQAERVAPEIDLPGGHDPQRAFEEAHIEVRLGARRNGSGIVRPVQPDRVDLQERAEQRQDAEREQEVGARLGHEHRVERVAVHLLLGLVLDRHRGVLLVPHDHHVRGDQPEQQRGDQQDVQHVQARHDVLAGELSAEQEHVDVGADDRDRLRHALGDPQAGAGQQVVRQRVPEQALQDAQREHAEADEPVQLAGLAVGAGEEDPQHVRHEGRHEQDRRPVVDLPHQQAAADVEADVQRRGVGLGHLHALQRRVRALVHDLDHARLEPERQERPGQQQDDEGVQGDLAQHERPVVGEDLLDVAPEEGGGPEALVDEAQRALDCLRGGGVAHPRSQKLGPMGSG